MKKAKKTLAVLFAAIIVFMTINVPLMPKADEHANQVHVIIKNETYSTEEGAAWEGTKTESEGEDIEKAPATKDEIMAMGADLTGIVSKSLTAEVCVYGNEWTVMTAARAGVLTDEMKNVYYESLVKELSDNSDLDGKAVTYANVILTLSAIGKNPENVNGVNLLKPLSDLDFVVKAGVNSTMYVLLALDSKDYNIPTAEAGKTQTTREALVAEILSHEIIGGGWDWSDAAADTDMTAIGIQSLTPYYNINAEAKAAVDRGLAVLSDMQNADGSFSSYGSKNACSAAQVITALMGMGINPLTDDRFIKGGYTAFDGINAFYVSGQGVKGYGNVIDIPFSTIQSAYAFVAYDRVLNGKTALYDMTDVSAVEDKKAEEVEKNEKSPNTGDEAPIDFVVMLIMVSGLGIITQKRRIRV